MPATPKSWGWPSSSAPISFPDKRKEMIGAHHGIIPRLMTVALGFFPEGRPGRQALSHVGILRDVHQSAGRLGRQQGHL